MMEDDLLRSAWQTETAQTKTPEEIKRMLHEGAHPVLRGIRKQLILESLAFTIFILVYYDFFDGHLKPLYANIVLVAAMGIVIVHNMMGYALTKSPLKGDNIKRSLEDRLSKMKIYAISSVLSRSLAAGCLLLFFMSAVLAKALSNWTVVAVLFILLIQMALLSMIWKKRINRLKSAVETFTS